MTVAALWLSACMEGSPPQALVRNGTEPEAPPSEAREPVEPPAPLESAGVWGKKKDPEPEPTPPLPPVVASSRLAFVPAGVRSVAAASAVDVELSVSGVNGKGRIDVEFIAPGDMPYERRSVTVHALPAESRTLSFSLPVAGTLIASSAMTGAWEARFFLDGEPLASAAFTLDP